LAGTVGVRSFSRRMPVKIKNINGTSQRKCPCGSWLSHWEYFSRQTVRYCSEVSCLGQDLVGAHVQKAWGDDAWYIVPLCSTHNQYDGWLDISDATTLVSANKGKTCERP
jgi:hypothetical protein